MNLRSVIGVTALLFGVVACGGKGAPEQAAAPTPSAQAPALAESSPAAAMAGSPAVDIASLKACEIVTPQEAAAIIGVRTMQAPMSLLLAQRSNPTTKTPAGVPALRHLPC